jgi:hypothetical protein
MGAVQRFAQLLKYHSVELTNGETLRRGFE